MVGRTMGDASEASDIAMPRASVRRVFGHGITRVLAIAGIALLAYQIWTMAGWICDGPHQITVSRERSTPSWYAARVLEILVVASIAGFLVRAVRERRREGRLGTDSLLIIGMFTAAFWDPIYNWIRPAWLYSSNLLNVNDWMAHAPGIVNPVAGDQPWPIIVVLVGYPLWGVGFAIVSCRAMELVRKRRPLASSMWLAVVGLVTATLLTWASFGLFKFLGLMSAPGYRLPILANSDVLLLGFSGGIVFAALAWVRFFRDDQHRAFFERGADTAPPRVLSVIATCQLIVIIGWGLLTVPFSLYCSPYPELAHHIVNNLCDAPGISGTRYGPCPGSPAS